MEIYARGPLMGLWGATKRAAKKVGRSLKTASGEIARDAAIASAAVGAGAACAIPPLTPAAPACAAVAAIATDKLLGDAIERKTRQAIDRTGQEADDFVDALRKGESGGPPPPGLARTVSGQTLVGTVRGGAIEEDEFPVALFITASTLITATITLLVLRKLGRI